MVLVTTPAMETYLLTFMYVCMCYYLLIDVPFTTVSSRLIETNLHFAISTIVLSILLIASLQHHADIFEHMTYMKGNTNKESLWLSGRIMNNQNLNNWNMWYRKEYNYNWFKNNWEPLFFIYQLAEGNQHAMFAPTSACSCICGFQY